MIRLFVEAPLAARATLTLSKEQSHYVLNVMRLKAGNDLLLFNGHDGEWRATLQSAKKSGAELGVKSQTRQQMAEPDLRLLFAPIKRGHGDFIIEKASELGVSKLVPVITQHTVVSRVPVDRYRAIATEAAEQSMRLSVPKIMEAQNLQKALENWDKNRPLLWGAEAGEARPVVEVLQNIKPGPLAVLTGPEGGFSEEEFSYLRTLPYIHPVRLGPRILRADTAAIAMLALTQALCGDWTNKA